MIKAAFLPGPIKNPQPERNNFVIALAGNPNVGKSTVFNRLTGLNQHTGNWRSGVLSTFSYRNLFAKLVDLPHLLVVCHSADKQTARDFICFQAG